MNEVTCMHSETWHPFIQTHTFEVEPYLKRTQGYAPFLAGPFFTGRERVEFQSLNGTPFPDTGTSERRLTEFQNGNWFLSDVERMKSATSGALAPGDYRFVVHSDGNKRRMVDLMFQPHFVEPAFDLAVQDRGDALEISWRKPPAAENFWVFVIPTRSANFFEALLPVSEKRFSEQRFLLRKNELAPGSYRCVLRTNAMLKPATFDAFSSEAWSLCPSEFFVPEAREL